VLVEIAGCQQDTHQFPNERVEDIILFIRLLTTIILNQPQLREQAGVRGKKRVRRFHPLNELGSETLDDNFLPGDDRGARARDYHLITAAGCCGRDVHGKPGQRWIGAFH
jgi:hypothetical protein